ncbi:hypothetical protein PFICI_02768 [Pestalotiopsis fici W106-1]|uniref:MINDY deubiquitinase domain-containing protein n=1 Tax=Pestalotiopsis fici (strain W106-1 / CGMCC3.15140) TaxID=1229662 RepID=W3XF91_PESFW|nr:uncharacterized protein PFICI_02768 [Pestalotiopsis fici W106-1]ETS84743.1 hypothetical protein PFICI_02768 [Pestalotiopsis fici W106-1]
MVSPKPSSSDANNDVPPSIRIHGPNQDVWSPSDPEMDGGNVWEDLGAGHPHQGNGSNPATQDVPEALRPGVIPKSSFDTTEENPWEEPRKDTSKPKITLEHTPTVLRPGGKLETNPFKRKPVSTAVSSSNANVTPARPNADPVVPTETFSKLQVTDSDSNINPWKPSADEPQSTSKPPIPSISRQDSEKNIWGAPPIGQVSEDLRENSPTPMSLPSGRESPAWDEVNRAKPSLGSVPTRSTEEQEISQDAHAWDDLGDLIGPNASVKPSLSRQSTWENFVDGEEEQKESTPISPPPIVAADEPVAEAQPVTETEPAVVTGPSEPAPPPLPPRRAESPTQPATTTTSNATDRTETYQIKNINWFDANASQNPRRSPILIQNVNGPCPLVALVNALTLTTPADLPNTVLVETLRTREQISLNLLLEAVFDELMSPRRTKSDAALPDVSELYAFLKGLHTGMNVNPRYVPTPELVNLHKRNSTHVHPSERDDTVPGTFEDTRDMKLYSTFSIPLIHGWLPRNDDPAYAAFSRQATSYDEAQNLMFREEELEDKLSNSSAGLTEQEQQIYQDIITIRSWLSSSATQLTRWGLTVITKSIQPGTFAILFRNDHFSALYRHPQTHQLFSLVTDAGFYTHDEIVWESLVDVNGERTEFFSGDFRLVGGPEQGLSQNVQEHWYDADDSGAQGGEWQTVRNRNGRNAQGRSDPPGSPMSGDHEQEDRDLALALQLQEEEDERHRNEQAARRRESQLSEQFIEQQGRGGTARTGPLGRGGNARGGSVRGGLAPARTSSASINVPVRGGSNTARGGRPVQQVRPLVPPVNTTHRPTNPEDEDAPPSYEQASRAEPYVPPTGHPNHPSSTPSSATTARRRTTLSGNGPPQPSPPQAGPSNPGGMGRGRPMAAHQQSASVGRDKDCLVM